MDWEKGVFEPHLTSVNQGTYSSTLHPFIQQHTTTKGNIMTDITPNYTDAMVASLREGYDPEASDETRKAQVRDLAITVGRSEASVRAKLTREGIYVPLTKAPAGKAPIRKAQIVQVIADALDVDVDVIGSLEKATKNTLIRIANALIEE